MKKKFLSMVLASGLALTGVFGSVPSVYADTNVGHVNNLNKKEESKVLVNDDFNSWEDSFFQQVQGNPSVENGILKLNYNDRVIGNIDVEQGVKYRITIKVPVGQVNISGYFGNDRDFVYGDRDLNGYDKSYEFTPSKSGNLRIVMDTYNGLLLNGFMLEQIS